MDFTGFYSLFSVTDCPFVSSGGKVLSPLILGTNRRRHRTWDAILLEGQWGSGIQIILHTELLSYPDVSYMFAVANSHQERIQTHGRHL